MLMKLASATMIGCLALLAQVSSSQSDFRKSTDTDKALIPSTVTDAHESSGNPESDSNVERKLTVTVALVQKNWAESINGDKPVFEELKELYEGVDVSELLELGRELPDVAPTLIFPEDRAAIFSYADFAKLFVRLKALTLIESVKTEPVHDSEVESFGTYSFERVTVTGLDVPVHEGRSSKDRRPFEKHIGSWSIGVGTDSRSENAVICDRLYSQFVETDWPTRTNQIDRQLSGTHHFGGRFDLLPGEVAVLRWSPTEHLRKGGEEADNSPTFAIITVTNGTALPVPDMTQEGWAKPLKTAALGRFDYNGFSQSIRRAEFMKRGQLAKSRPSGIQATAGEATTGSNDESEKPARLTRIFRLQQIDVTEAANLVKQLYANDSGFSMAPDVRTNTLLVSGSNQSINTISDVLATLDVPSNTSSESPDAVRKKGKPIEVELGPAGTIILKGHENDVTAAKQILSQMSSQQLLDRSRHLQDKATSLTRDHVVDDGVNEQDLSELKQTVTEDFDVRQRLQLAEIGFLKARLNDLERRVRQKERLKSLIIDKRIEALLSKPTQD